MQTLLVIRGGRVTVQTAEKTYTDTVENFVIDGGVMPTDFTEIDYCRDTASCRIDGVPSVAPAYAENVIQRIDVYIESFESRKAIREEAERVERNERMLREQAEAEQARWNALTVEEQQAEIQQKYSDAVQVMLDDKAREKLYDNMNSLCSYIGSSNEKFAMEARLGSDWRDAIWAKCYELLDRVKSGEMQIPSVEEFLTMLPQFSWK